jgi:hypothetical protein
MGAKDKPRWHSGFLRMLPTIRRNARYAFRNLSPELRDECVQDVICNCCIAYRRLFRKGQLDRAFPSALALYAIRQVRSGRQSGTKLNVRDVLSRHCQIQKGVKVVSIYYLDPEDDEWKEMVLEDNRTTSPADLAAFRLDYPAWLSRFAKRDQNMIAALARGERTRDMARRFRLSEGRVSQKRREYEAEWRAYLADA